MEDTMEFILRAKWLFDSEMDWGLRMDKMGTKGIGEMTSEIKTQMK